MKKEVLVIPLLSVLLMTTGLYAGVDTDGDSVIDSLDECPQTINKMFRDGYVRSNGCADIDHDGYFPGLSSTDPHFDPNDGNGCKPNRTSPACKTNDADGDGVINREDPKPKRPCIPNPNSLACRNSKKLIATTQSMSTVSVSDLEYINPYRTTRHTSTSTYHHTQVPQATLPQPEYISMKDALTTITNMTTEHHSPSQTTSVLAYMEKGESGNFDYYNMTVALLNILQDQGLIHHRHDIYTVPSNLKNVYVEASTFDTIMSRLTALLDA